MAKGDRVARPTKRGEYELRFATSQARRGWLDLQATIRNPLVDAWDFLTRTPTAVTPTNYRLRSELATVARDGVDHQRWQHKPTSKGDARIWFFVVGNVVFLEQVHTHHPNQTK